MTDHDECERRLRDLEALLDLEMQHADSLLRQVAAAEARCVELEVSLAAEQMRCERSLVPSKN